MLIVLHDPPPEPSSDDGQLWWHARRATDGPNARVGFVPETLLQAAEINLDDQINDEGASVDTGSDERTFYCGRTLGLDVMGRGDGNCGPNNGPQCPSCVRFGQAMVARAKSANKKSPMEATRDGLEAAQGTSAGPRILADPLPPLTRPASLLRQTRCVRR